MRSSGKCKEIFDIDREILLECLLVRSGEK